jgi:hypothetical protein
MCGCSERNLECSDAFTGDGLLMTSASVARSAEDAWGEYPGAVV